MNNVSEKGSDFIQDLGDAVRNNPLSAALIGMGVLWLFAGSQPIERVGDFARSSGLDRIPDAAGNAFEAARSTLRSGTDAVGERVASAKDIVKDGVVDAFDSATRYGREYADTASENASSIPGSSGEIFDTVRSNLSDFFRAQPLALGAIGIAIGAGIAAAFPATQIEADYLGETSDTVKKTAAQFAAEQTDRVTSVAGNVVKTVKEEATTQGLSLDGAKTAAGDISAKIGRVVDATGKSISDRANLGKL
jgi:hypothetical protein